MKDELTTWQKTYFSCMSLLLLGLFVSAMIHPCRVLAQEAKAKQKYQVGPFKANTLTVSTNKPPTEVWLTPERREALKRVTHRPYIVKQEKLNDTTVVYTWTNGLHGTVTTQKVDKVLGKKATSAWQTRLDKKDKEKADLIADIKAVKDKPTKKQLEDLLTKHEKKSNK